MIDFNNLKDSLVPAKTVAVVQMNLRSGPDYLDGIHKPTKKRDAYGLDIEYRILEGPYVQKRLYGFALTMGEKDGQKSMAEERTLPFLKGILNSAYFLDPTDSSPAACEKRKREFRDFDNLRFLAEIGIEKSKDATYPDKNIVVRAITRDMPQWEGRPPIEQIGPTGGSTGGGTPGAPPPSPPPAPIDKPKWAS
jgi:hypothetical protein